MAENTENYENDFPCIVVDNSYLVSFLLGKYCENERSEAERVIRSVLEKNGQFYVPQLFWFEIENVLLLHSRKNRKGEVQLTSTEVEEIRRDLSELPIYTDLQPDAETRTRIGVYAREYDLSYYDASYLELARRYNLKLYTFDADLKAAYEAGIE